MPKFRKWLKRFSYFFLFLFSFFLFLYWSFPYLQIVNKLLQPHLRRARLSLSIGKLKPHYLTGIHAEKINIQKKVKKGIAEVQIDQLTARVSLLPLALLKIALGFEVKVARGKIFGEAAYSWRSGELAANIRIKNLQLASLGPPLSAYRHFSKDNPPKPLLTTLFAPVWGKVSLKLKGKMPLSFRRKRRRRRRYYRRRGINLKKLKADLRLKISNLSIGPGYLPTSQMGELPVPRIRFGTLRVHLKIAKGRANIVQFFSHGIDGELNITGYVKLRNPFLYSYYHGKIKFKLSQAFLDSLNTPTLGLLKGGINMLGPGRRGYHLFRARIPFRGRPDLRRQY